MFGVLPWPSVPPLLDTADSAVRHVAPGAFGWVLCSPITAVSSSGSEFVDFRCGSISFRLPLYLVFVANCLLERAALSVMLTITCGIGQLARDPIFDWLRVNYSLLLMFCWLTSRFFLFRFARNSLRALA